MRKIIELFGKRLLVEQVDEEDRVGSLWVPPTATAKLDFFGRARVIQAGTEVSLDLDPGDIVLIPTNRVMPLSQGTKTLYIADESDIWATLGDDINEGKTNYDEEAERNARDEQGD